ncbi:hypothetical protein A2U01_0067867, partial [Trifolium medium]|nr:hypothetical protein [Trifolium medium]
ARLPPDHRRPPSGHHRPPENWVKPSRAAGGPAVDWRPPPP